MILRRPASLDAASPWSELVAPGSTTGSAREPVTFDAGSVAGLPDPARRWLTRSLVNGTPLLGGVVLRMRGRIRLGPRWFAFTADQVLRAGCGFVWRAVVGGRVARVEGVDVLSSSEARMEFHLCGRVPLVSATGGDVRRSAAGRLAGETVSWLPAAFVPGSTVWPGVDPAWRAVDAERAVVTVPTPVEPVDVEISVGGDGRLRSLCFPRWRESADPPGYEPFGGVFGDEFVDGDGRELSGHGAVGWGWGTPLWDTGEFFRFEIVDGHAVR